MSTLERIPYLSLVLLLLSYSTLGWMISEARAPWFIWSIAVVSILILLAILTVPVSILNQYFNSLFKSTTSSFIVTVLAAFLFFVVLAWFRVFLDTLLIISATILAKIDFQSARFKAPLTFFVTSICAISGLVIGVVIYRLAQYLVS
jgi:hypothetical protein